MKNFINYYYNFYINDIHLVDGKYFFSYNDNHYMFKKCDEILPYIDSIYELSKVIDYKGSYYHQLVLNKDKSLVTFFENKPFIMLKLSNVGAFSVSIFDIKSIDIIRNMNKKLVNLNKFNWTILWEKKIDYFEYYILNKKEEYRNLLDSFYYHVGMAENAILYVKEALMNTNEDYMSHLVVSHRRFNKNMTLLSFYDPTALIIDHRSRDIAEFLKYLFLINDYDFSTIKDYFYKYKLTKLDAHLIFGRLLFPSFYFDYLENTLFNNKIECSTIIEARIDEYNSFLIEIYNILVGKFEMQEIQWIIKKTQINHLRF